MTLFGYIMMALAVQLTLASAALAETCASSATSADFRPGTVSPMLFGTHLLFNQATDSLRGQPGFMSSLLSVPVHALRFPGGTIGDNYLWSKRQTARQDWFPFNHSASADDLDFDEFMSVAKCLGAQPSIVINLRYWVAAGQLKVGIAEAENWVRYANKEQAYGVRYWELGNEIYGRNPQAQSPMTSRDYGQYYSEFRRRLKAVDPSVELGLVLPADTNLVATADTESWWNGALAGTEGEVDYVVIHRYVVPRPKALERKGSTYDDMLGAAKSKLRAVLGRDVPVHLTEWNIGSRSASREGPVKHGTIGHALFVADAIVDQVKHGVRFATFWPLIGPKDQGFLNKSDMSLNAPGQVMQMLEDLAGWRIVDHERNAGELEASIYKGPDGRLGVVVINWRQTDMEYDWKKWTGSCDISGEVLSPGRHGGVDRWVDAPIQRHGVADDQGVLSIPARSFVVAMSKQGVDCGE